MDSEIASISTTVPPSAFFLFFEDEGFEGLEGEEGEGAGEDDPLVAEAPFELLMSITGAAMRELAALRQKAASSV
jgi:hypothetical protein